MDCPDYGYDASCVTTTSVGHDTYSELPQTGSDAHSPVVLGVILVVAGVIAVLIARSKQIRDWHDR